ncbi:MAG: NUDIX domain-containing protein [Syntrophobacteraceae bacterium]|jgi:ADP-ribose pyrophosphatase YjhB (NUDIX family)
MTVKDSITCPKCGATVTVYRNPLLTVDIIIEMGEQGVVLIKRKNPPHGWAIPGGFVDYGESLEAAASREAGEETGLELEELRQFRAYSDPDRDPRSHTVSVVFTARGRGIPKAADDAGDIGVFRPDALPQPLAFDHERILADYFAQCTRDDLL